MKNGIINQIFSLQYFFNYFDIKQIGLTLLIKPKTNNYGRHQITIQFNQSYLVNNTDLDLICYQGFEKNLEILGGQKYNTSLQLIVLQNIQEKQIVVFEERNSNLKSSPLILSEIIKLETVHLKKKENNLLYFLPIQIEKKFIQYGDYTIPFFKMNYKYNLFNRLAQPIYLCYEDKTILLESLIKRPLQFWNQEHLNNPDFSYECSLRINFDDSILYSSYTNYFFRENM